MKPYLFVVKVLQHICRFIISCIQLNFVRPRKLALCVVHYFFQEEKKETVIHNSYLIMCVCVCVLYVNKCFSEGLFACTASLLNIADRCRSFPEQQGEDEKGEGE